MIDPLQYSVGVPAEDLRRYCPGGYHPVHINDILDDGKYEVLQKLGFGSFSTVWLAWDKLYRRGVSIKIVMANNSGPDNQELAVLQRLRDRVTPQHTGHEHVAQLFDSFYVTGPNGRHLCLVLELLGPRTSLVAERSPDGRLPATLARRVSAQALQAVNYLHSCGVAHGDVHMGNLLFQLSDENLHSPQRIIEEFGPPQIGVVSKKDGSPSDVGVPRHLVAPVRYGRGLARRFKDVRLADFGESFFVSNPPNSVHTPLPFHPPELIFRHTLTEAIDIWNLGVTTFKIITGRILFDADFDDRELIPQFRHVLGGVPERWLRQALESGLLESEPDDFVAEDYMSLEQELKEAYSYNCKDESLRLSDSDLMVLATYLRKMLVVDPGLRSTARDLLRELWITQVDLHVEF